MNLPPKKYPYYSKGICPKSYVPKIFTNVLRPYVKSDERKDRDCAEPVRPIILELRTNFLQKWGPGAPKMVPP